MELCWYDAQSYDTQDHKGTIISKSNLRIHFAHVLYRTSTGKAKMSIWEGSQKYSGWGTNIFQQWHNDTGSWWRSTQITSECQTQKLKGLVGQVRSCVDPITQSQYARCQYGSGRRNVPMLVFCWLRHIHQFQISFPWLRQLPIQFCCRTIYEYLFSDVAALIALLAFLYRCIRYFISYRQARKRDYHHSGIGCQFHKQENSQEVATITTTQETVWKAFQRPLGWS